MICPGCTNFRGLLSEVVIAQFAFNMFGRNMQSLTTLNMAAKSVVEHCYMDGLMPWAPTVELKLSKLGDKAGFHIWKWLSNDVDVIADIKEEDKASEIDLEKR